MLELNLFETRVLGALFEKERTTPDQYPLSLNALITACNQKSNRDPVLELSESDVQNTIDELTKKGLVTEQVLNSRVRRYKQRFGNTEFSDFKLNLKEQALLCVLFLRGPQTPGELRTRSQRLAEFNDINELEETLRSLCEHSPEPFVLKLAREPGKRESRYIHLFTAFDMEALSQTSSPTAALETSSNKPKNDEQESRIALLEEQVNVMQEQIDVLKAAWDELNG